jgi:hypothetical protein
VRNDLTDISIVLDRSGSMASVWEDTIGGFNSFIEAQRKLPGACSVSAIQFDNKYDTLYTARPVSEAPLLNKETYIPRGMTALLDAIGRTITNTGARLSALPEDQRPSKVIFVILTDGAENSSREFSREQVFLMIKLQREAYQWEFVFLGANQDAIATAAGLGMAAGSSMTYAANAKGTLRAFASASNYVGQSRAGAADAAFSDEDRKAQADAGAKT